MLAFIFKLLYSIFLLYILFPVIKELIMTSTCSPLVFNYPIQELIEPNLQFILKIGLDLRAWNTFNSREFEYVRRCRVSENLYHARVLSSLTRRNLSSSLIRGSRCSQVFPWQWDRTLNEVSPAAAIFQMKNTSRSDVATGKTYLLAFPTSRKFPSRYITNNFPWKGVVHAVLSLPKSFRSRNWNGVYFLCNATLHRMQIWSRPGRSAKVTFNLSYTMLTHRT